MIGPPSLLCYVALHFHGGENCGRPLVVGRERGRMLKACATSTTGASSSLVMHGLLGGTHTYNLHAAALHVMDGLAVGGEEMGVVPSNLPPALLLYPRYSTLLNVCPVCIMVRIQPKSDANSRCH